MSDPKAPEDVATEFRLHVIELLALRTALLVEARTEEVSWRDAQELLEEWLETSLATSAENFCEVRELTIAHLRACNDEMFDLKLVLDSQRKFLDVWGWESRR